MMHKPTTYAEIPLPAPGEGKRGESGHIGYLLRQAGNAYHNRLAHALVDLCITPPQFSVMTMIAAYPGLSNADIARLALLTPQTVSLIIGNLVKANIVARRPHAVHGRIRHLELTAKGTALLKTAKKRVKAVDEEIMDGIAAENEVMLRRWLAGVAAKLSAA